MTDERHAVGPHWAQVQWVLRTRANGTAFRQQIHAVIACVSLPADGRARSMAYWQGPLQNNRTPGKGVLALDSTSSDE